MKFQRTIAILMIAGIMGITLGCWDRREINQLVFVTAAGIDYADENTVKFSVQTFAPKGNVQQMGGNTGSAAGGTTFVRSAEGVTVADAMSKLQEQFSRELFWGHCETFVIGKRAAEEGIIGHIEFLMKYPFFRERAYVFVSNGSAVEMIKGTSPLETIGAEKLRKMAEERIGLKVTVKDLALMLAGDAETAAIPMIVWETKRDEVIRGSAIFKKGKLIGTLNGRKTRGLLWLRDEINKATATVKLDGGDELISMQLLRSRTERIPKLENGKWKMLIKIYTVEDIAQNTTNLDFSNPKYSIQLSKKLETSFKQYIGQTLEDVQKEMKADVIGFAEAFQRKYPKQWREARDRWDEIFPNVEVSVQVQALVKRTGMSTPGAVKPEEDVKK